MANAERSHPIDFPERAHILSIIGIFEDSGYKYEADPTHRDERGQMHFRRDLGQKTYPHLHLIYHLPDEIFSLHLDTRRHRTQYFSPHISIELERLYKHFKNELQTKGALAGNLFALLAKQALAYAIFNTSDELNDNRRRINPMSSLSKIHKSRRLKGPGRDLYRRKRIRITEDDVIFGGSVEDWEPLSETLLNTKTRHDPKVDKN